MVHDPDRSAGVRGLRQQTLKNSINCTGIGLHGGAKVNMVLRPAAPDSGIRFRRLDVDAAVGDVPARWDRVCDTTLCTAIGNAAGVKVGTIEHLMAALAGCGIDNALVELDGPEVPIMDGSAAPFVFLVECAGVVEQAAPRRAIRVLKPVEVRDGARRCALLPADRFSVELEIDFESTGVARQAGAFDLHDGTFKREICRARTFGFERDVERLRALGLARGGSLDNAVVVGADDRILNAGGLRYDDEFVRHKVLDCVGDLYLAGGPLLGHFRGVRSGHALNNRLLRRLFADADAWTFAVAMPPLAAEPLAATA